MDNLLRLFPEIVDPKKRAYVIALLETGKRVHAAASVAAERWATPADGTMNPYKSSTVQP